MDRKLLTFCLLAVVAACGPSKDKLLQSRADEVRKLLEETKRNPVAAGSFSSSVNSAGMNITAYLKANLPEPKAGDIAFYETGQPSKPYCVYIKRGLAAGEYIIEGYASDPARPTVSVTASVDPKLVPDWDSAGPTQGDQAAGQPGKDVTQAPVILSVNPQWIISDSERKLEITLLGQNLSHEASVISQSPQLRVDRVDADPVRTLVIAFMDPSAPPGDYELQYQAPGGTSIPFTIRYTKP